LHGAFADKNEITDRHKWKTDKQQIRGGDKKRGGERIKEPMT